jgi:hypothetical protein
MTRIVHVNVVAKIMRNDDPAADLCKWEEFGQKKNVESEPFLFIIRYLCFNYLNRPASVLVATSNPAGGMENGGHCCDAIILERTASHAPAMQKSAHWMPGIFFCLLYSSTYILKWFGLLAIFCWRAGTPLPYSSASLASRAARLLLLFVGFIGLQGRSRSASRCGFDWVVFW